MRAARVWHVESRDGWHYSTNQHGGYSRHSTHAEAVQDIEEDIERYGDTWDKSLDSVQTEPTPYNPTVYGVTTDYEYSAEHKRQKLDIWEGSFFSSWTGTAYSLPNGGGFMVTTYNDGAKVRVSCPSPRTADNYLEVDAALSAALNEYFEKAGFVYVGSPYGSQVDMESQRDAATD